MARHTSRRELRRFRKEHVGRLFAEIHRDFSQRISERLVAAGHQGLSAAHLKVLRSLPLDGARLTTLAERVGITAQSAGARVDELAALGYLERAADPTDGRAVHIRFSRRGRHLLVTAQSLVADVERHYAALLGKTRFEDLKSSLAVLVAGLEIDIPA